MTLQASSGTIEIVPGSLTDQAAPIDLRAASRCIADDPETNPRRVAFDICGCAGCDAFQAAASKLNR